VQIQVKIKEMRESWNRRVIWNTPSIAKVGRGWKERKTFISK
jgi:hypothetical protein